jgi:hydroxycarboxylate dehydrogenase B
VKSSPPIEAGGRVLLPGEIEQQTRKDREITGLAIDEETWRQITTTAASLGVESPKV